MTQREGPTPYAVVVGGANLDIGGRAYAPLSPRDSNPGRVRVSPGGVGRNIAHNLALLGVDVYLLTALGEDANAGRMAACCAQAGIDLSHALRVPGESTSVYLFINGPDGDMALALADMDIYRHITPAFLQSRSGLLQNARLVVADANLPAGSLDWLARSVDAPLFADPVSTAKAERLRPILGRLHTLKPNRIEAQLLSGVPIHSPADAPRAARALLDTGLERVFISLGEEGIYAADRAGGLALPCLPAQVKNATGAGDAALAALAWAQLEGGGLEYAARAALAAAAIALEGEETVNPELSVRVLRQRMTM